MNQNKKNVNRNNKPNNRNSRNNRRNSKSKSKEVEINVSDSKINAADLPHVLVDGKANNDYRWYNKIQNLVKDYANLSYNQVLGLPMSPYSRLPHSTGQPSNSGTTTQVPGMLILELAPTIGVANSNLDAINIAGQQIYNIMRKANSGAVNNYDKTDVMMLFQAVDSAYMLYEEMCRAYGLLCSWKETVANRYIPEHLLTSLGFSITLANEMNDFEGLLDFFAYKLETMVMPNEFSFISRHSWLFSHVYKDRESSKAQLYAYKPAGFYVWTEGQDDKATQLTYTTRNKVYGGLTQGIVTTVSQLWTALNTIMEPILGSGDIGYINSDMQKAFGVSDSIKIRPIGNYPIVEPVYEPEVLLQMSNCSILNAPLVDNNIVVNNGNLVTGPYLTCQPKFSVSNPFDAMSINLKYSRKHLLNMPMDAPTPDDNMVATRLVWTADSTDSQNDAKAVNITSCGTEIITSCTMWMIGDETNTLKAYEVDQDYAWPLAHPTGSQLSTTVLESMIANLRTLTLLSNFDWHPTVYSWMKDAEYDDLADTQLIGYYTDMNQFVFLDNQTVANLNQAAVMSEYVVDSYPKA